MDGQGATTPCFLLDGSYRGIGTWFSLLVVKGSKVVVKDTNGEVFADVKVEIGNFGEADAEIIKSTGKKFYNVQMTIPFGKDVIELGVISADGLKITTKGLTGITVLEWITEEEVAAMEEDKDPIEAPAGPYKVQPENPGKFLWITGAPGLGKSTSAQMLCRSAGYVYYEADCFADFRNPYIPPDVENPSMAQMYQKTLKGEGLEERKALLKRTMGFFEQLMSGEDYDTETAKEYYEGMCEDIRKERERIGGDWAIAAVTFSRELRDLIRSKLGPDLVFVILTMDLEDVKKRVMKRHDGHEGAVEMLTAINKMCERAGEDEENAVNVEVTNEMSEEDVVKKILELVK